MSRKSEYLSKLTLENQYLQRKIEEREKEYAMMKSRLTAETERLASLLSAQVNDCKIGPWCDKCKYFGADYSKILYHRLDSHGSYYLYDDSAGVVRYCLKHFADICPEFESPKS